jgi:predicted RNase H-like nuclease
VILAGVDLAWFPDKNPTAIATGDLINSVLTVVDIQPAVFGIQNILSTLIRTESLQGVAIDASLIINNETGQRPCEKKVSKVYGSRYASCHASNRKLYPNAASVHLSQELESLGYMHLSANKFQIECYPHPAIIEIFGLPERLKYKKGRVLEKKSGQKVLASLIRSLSGNNVLKLDVPAEFDLYFDEDHIDSLKGKTLKSNEDALDAIVCLYIAGLYAVGAEGRAYGDTGSGYVWIPASVYRLLSCTS